jgi:hypothetical protein
MLQVKPEGDTIQLCFRRRLAMSTECVVLLTGPDAGWPMRVFALRRVGNQHRPREEFDRDWSIDHVPGLWGFSVSFTVAQR